MKQKTFIIRDESIISNLVSFLKSLPDNTLVECLVREHKKKREVIQNSLYWFWLGFVENETGMPKDGLHNFFKKRFLVKIFERDDYGYADMIHAVRKVSTDGFRLEALQMERQIVKLTSTTTATTKQFAEYLTEIERYMAGKGIVLPRKEDQYYDAMMIRRY